MSQEHSRDSSPHSIDDSSKDRDKRTRRKNSFNSIAGDTDEEEGEIEDRNGNVLNSVSVESETETDPHWLRSHDRNRDVSPSAQSHHSSGTGVALEWDPSADVGAQIQVPSNTPVHQSLLQQNPNLRKARLDDIESGDLSALDQIVLALNYGYDLRPYVAESRSERFDIVNNNSNNNSDTGTGTDTGHGQNSSPPPGQTSRTRSSKGSSSEASNNSNSSYKTATETDPDQCLNPQDPSANVSDITNASASASWQTSGLTRSEIKYMKRKREGSSSHSSSSVLWVEVNALNEDGEEKDQSNNTNNSSASRPRDTTTASEINGDTTSTSFSRKSVGIQTKMKEEDLHTNQELEHLKPALIGQKSKAKTKAKGVQACENIKTGTTLVSVSQSKLYRNHKSDIDNNNYRSRTQSGSGTSSGRSAISSGAAVAAVTAYSAHHYSSHPVPLVQSVSGPGSGRSLGSLPSTSGHKNGDKGESSGHSSGSGNSNLNSSDHLTPTCALLDKIITEGNSSMRNYGYDVLEQHRNSLVYKMRKEFQHLERLNKILLEKRQGQHHHKTGTRVSSHRVAVETSVSISDASSSGLVQDNDMPVKTSKLPQSRARQESTSASSDNIPSSSGSKGDSNGNVQIKYSRKPEYPAEKPGQGKGVTKKVQTKPEVYERRKPVSYFLPLTLGPGFNGGRVIPSMESMKVKASISNGNGGGGRRNARVGPSTRGYPNGDTEKENQRPSVQVYRDQEGQTDFGELTEGEHVDLHGGVGGGYVIFENELVQISLQQAFEHYCPTVMSSVQQREFLLNQIKQERECKSKIKRSYFQERQNCLSPNDSLNKAFPAKETRVMSTREMRHLTEKKMKKLPEVQEKVVRRRLEEDKKTNRILSQVFSRKLRQHVLKGDMNIVHSKNLIRH